MTLAKQLYLIRLTIKTLQENKELHSIITKQQDEIETLRKLVKSRGIIQLWNGTPSDESSVV